MSEKVAVAPLVSCMEKCTRDTGKKIIIMIKYRPLYSPYWEEWKTELASNDFWFLNRMFNLGQGVFRMALY